MEILYPIPDENLSEKPSKPEEGLPFKSETFPEDVAELCKAYLKHFGLRFGAFDFIEDTNGRIVFLECNPNGQYGWLEADLGFPISAAIAGELIRIADSG